MTPPHDATSVLIVSSDSSGFSKILRSKLEQDGLCVTVVATGAEAVEAAGGNHAVIFMDLDLPDVDGLSVLEQLRALSRSAGAPVRLLNGDGQAGQVIQRGFDLGASGYILKHQFQDAPEPGNHCRPSPHSPPGRHREPVSAPKSALYGLAVSDRLVPASP